MKKIIGVVMSIGWLGLLAYMYKAGGDSMNRPVTDPNLNRIFNEVKKYGEHIGQPDYFDNFRSAVGDPTLWDQFDEKDKQSLRSDRF